MTLALLYRSMYNTCTYIVQSALDNPRSSTSLLHCTARKGDDADIVVLEPNIRRYSAVSRTSPSVGAASPSASCRAASFTFAQPRGQPQSMRVP